MDHPLATVNPEVEVHSVDESFNDEAYNFETDTKVFPSSRTASNAVSDSETSAFPANVEVQKQDTNDLQEEESEMFELGPQFTWSDDDHSGAGGFGFNIYDSIAAIRKEASKLDAVLAVDQLESLKVEIRNVRRELQDRGEEVEELQALVQLKDDRIGTLELERDLYKADTNKLANDLESCLVKLRKVGGEQSDAPDESTYTFGWTGNQSEHGLDGKTNSIKGFGNGSPSSVLDVPKPSAISGQFNDRRKPSKKVDPPSCGSTSRTSVTASVTSRSVLARRAVPVFEKPRITAVATSQRRTDVPIRARTKSRAQGRSVRRTADAPDQKSKELERSAFLQEHVQELSQRLMSALDTSEELRRRLAMLNRYYEGSVNQLQLQLSATKTERFQLEFDLTRHITALERENNRLRVQLESGLLDENRAQKKHGVTFDV